MKTARLNKLNSSPLHEQVYQEILEALMSGRFEPGQKLTSRTLAAELGTSDMPVRTALSRLQALRVLSPLPNGVMEIPLMDRVRFADLMETRTFLERNATLKAIPNINGNALRTIRHHAKLLTEAAQNQNLSEYLLMNYNFKFSIYKHCQNDTLYYMIEVLWMQVGPFLRNFGNVFKGDLSGILELDYHPEIVMAIESRDANKAADLLCCDIREGTDYLLENAEFEDAET